MKNGKLRRFVLVGIAPAIVSNSVKALKQLDFEVVVIDNIVDIEKSRNLIQAVDKVVDANINDYDELRSVVLELNDEKAIYGMISFREFALLNTAKIIEELNLYGNSYKSVECCIDKLKSRDALYAGGLLSPQYTVYKDNESAIDFFRKVKGPIIIKPNNLAGSIGITKVNHEFELEEKLEEVKRQCKNSIIMLEEFVEGKEVSIESVVYRDEVYILGVTEKILYESTFIEAGHISPYQGNEMSIEEYKELVSEVVKVMGIKFGPLHIEGFHTPKGLILNDIHTRYGGDNIPIITELASGYNLNLPIFAQLANVDYELTSDTKRCSGIKFLQIKPGIIKEILGAEEVKKIEGIIDLNISCSVGDKIGDVKSNSDRHGWIIVQGNTREEVDEIFNKAFQLLDIVTY
ncbi:ATP-grasp domain-containing protein [Clostridium paraputrificum]|uniref:ATP-grasp domain-containing protein n=1 Tax=Clostridium paraputrificum TaxID=29363 RepID=UPI003D3536C9